jgi:hypothetical protein
MPQMPQIHRLFILLTFMSEANNLWDFCFQNVLFLISESVAIFLKSLVLNRYKSCNFYIIKRFRYFIYLFYSRIPNPCLTTFGVSPVQSTIVEGTFPP